MRAGKKTLFTVALVLEGLTMSDFAEGVGVSTAMVSQVLAGKRTSRRVSMAIEALTKKHIASGVLRRKR